MEQQCAHERDLGSLVICEPRLDAARAIVYDDRSGVWNRGTKSGGREAAAGGVVSVDALRLQRGLTAMLKHASAAAGAAGGNTGHCGFATTRAP